MNDDGPIWSNEATARLANAIILVGIEYNEPGGARLEQLFGTVISLDDSKGITLMLSGSRSGETFVLPPDLRAIFPAERGIYTLRQTGEIVTDPDFFTTWDVNPPLPSVSDF